MPLRNFFFLFLVFLNGVALMGQFQEEEQVLEETTGSEKLEFKIYPNPLRGNLLHVVTEEYGPKEILIYDVLGNLVRRIETLADEIILDGLKTGIYILKLVQNGKLGIKRLVVR